MSAEQWNFAPVAERLASGRPVTLGFLLVPGFSLVTLSCAMEAFRLANEHARETLFVCRTISARDAECVANDGTVLQTNAPVADTARHDIIFVVSSLSAVEHFDDAIARWLRSQVHGGAALAPIGSAIVLAAKTGLLNGYQCAVNWMLLPDFAERFPAISTTRDLFCFDRGRLTSAGGLATMDFGFAIAERLVGQPMAGEIMNLAEITMLSRVRPAKESQRMDVSWRYQVTDQRISTSLRLMEEYVERPLSIEAIAQKARISARQLERLFGRQFGKRPHRVYLDIRLRRASELLQQSTDSITSIALRCGFSDAPHLTRQFRAAFGQTPAVARWSVAAYRQSVQDR